MSFFDNWLYQLSDKRPFWEVYILILFLSIGFGVIFSVFFVDANFLSIFANLGSGFGGIFTVVGVCFAFYEYHRRRELDALEERKALVNSIREEVENYSIYLTALILIENDIKNYNLKVQFKNLPKDNIEFLKRETYVREVFKSLDSADYFNQKFQMLYDLRFKSRANAKNLQVKSSFHYKNVKQYLELKDKIIFNLISHNNRPFLTLKLRFNSMEKSTFEELIKKKGIYKISKHEKEKLEELKDKIISSLNL